MRTIYKITVGAVVGGVVVVVLLSNAVLNTLEAGRPGAAAAADAANAAEGGGILLSSAEWVEGIEETVLEGIQVLRNELDESIAFPGVHEDSRRSGELVRVHGGARQPPVSTPALRDFGFDSRHKQQGGGYDQHAQQQHTQSQRAVPGAADVATQGSNLNSPGNQELRHPALFGAAEKGAGAHHHAASNFLSHLCNAAHWPNIDHHRLFIIVLSSLTAVGAKQRAAARETWVGSARESVSDEHLKVYISLSQSLHTTLFLILFKKIIRLISTLHMLNACSFAYACMREHVPFAQTRSE